MRTPKRFSTSKCLLRGIDARFTYLYFCQRLPTLQRGLSVIANLRVVGGYWLRVRLSRFSRFFFGDDGWNKKEIRLIRLSDFFSGGGEKTRQRRRRWRRLWGLYNGAVPLKQRYATTHAQK